MNRPGSAIVGVGLCVWAGCITGSCNNSGGRHSGYAAGHHADESRMLEARGSKGAREHHVGMEIGGPIFGETKDSIVGPSGTIVFDVYIDDKTTKPENPVVEWGSDDSGTGSCGDFIASTTFSPLAPIPTGTSMFEVAFKIKDRAALAVLKAEDLEPVIFKLHFDGSFKTIECGFVIKIRDEFVVSKGTR